MRGLFAYYLRTRSLIVTKAKLVIRIRKHCTRMLYDTRNRETFSIRHVPVRLSPSALRAWQRASNVRGFTTLKFTATHIYPRVNIA